MDGPVSLPADRDDCRGHGRVARAAAMPGAAFFPRRVADRFRTGSMLHSGVESMDRPSGQADDVEVASDSDSIGKVAQRGSNEAVLVERKRGPVVQSRRQRLRPAGEANRRSPCADRRRSGEKGIAQKGEVGRGSRIGRPRAQSPVTCASSSGDWPVSPPYWRGSRAFAPGEMIARLAWSTATPSGRTSTVSAPSPTCQILYRTMSGLPFRNRRSRREWSMASGLAAHWRTSPL